jgi:hypothetical protein
MSKVYRFFVAAKRELGIRIPLANTGQALFAIDPGGPDGYAGSGSKRGKQEHHDWQRKIEIHAENPKDE